MGNGKQIFPLDIAAFDGSPRVKALKRDYQRWWYLRLCVAAFMNQERPGCIPDNPCELWKLAGVTAGRPPGLTLNPMRRVELEFAEVLACFVPTDDGWLTHNRVKRDVQTKAEIGNRRACAARSRVTANAEQLQNPESVFAFVLSDPKELENCFLRAWSVYPVKKAKANALKAFKKHASLIAKRERKPDFDSAEWLELRIGEYAKSGHVSQLIEAGKKNFIPYLSAWLNGGRYDDPAEEWEAPKEKSNGKQDLDRLYGDDEDENGE